MKILLFFLFICAIIFENSINQVEAGKINQEKSFDQIYGQRWDEGTEEIICQIDQIIHGQNADQNNQFGQNVRQFDQNFDENMEVKEEESEEMSTNCDELGDQLPMPTKNGQISDHFSNAIDKKKIEIVEKFNKIKEKIKQKEKKYSRKEWNKIERKIAKKLGANQRKIYKWKRECGMNIRNSYSDEEKREIVEKFDEIYGKLIIKLNEKLEGKSEKCQKILAKHLGTNIRSIQRWKKQFQKGNSVNNQKTDEQKREIVEKYFKLKNEFKQNGKHSQKEWKEFYGNKQMFGVNFRTIEIWTKKIGNNQNISKEKNVYTNVEKMEMMKQYYQLKNENKNLNDRKIAQIFKISTASLTRFKIAFKEKCGDVLKRTGGDQKFVEMK